MLSLNPNPSLQPENDYGIESLTPPTADLKCALSSIIYGIVIIFDARYPKSVSLNFLKFPEIKGLY